MDLDDPIKKELVKARIQLIYAFPFYGQLATRLNIVEAPWCKTAAVDGRNFYFNRDFISRLKLSEIIFLWAHEVLHCVFGHFGTEPGLDKDYMNMAQDYLINYILTHDHNSRVGTMPAGGLLDRRFTDEMTSREIYDIIVRENATKRETLDMHLDLSGGDGDSDDDDNELDSGSALVTVRSENGPPKLTEKELEQLRRELKSAIIQAVQSSGAGKLPKGLQRLIGDLVEPKLDWRSLLDTHIRSAVKDDYAYDRISRRTVSLRYAYREKYGDGAWMRAPILPDRSAGQAIELDVWIDASGSMTDAMIRDLLSETKGIMLTFPDFKVRVGTFDTQAYNYREFTPANINDIDTYEVNGGGGTMFECVWDYLKSNDIEPHRLVIFTDGYPAGSWGDPNYCDTLFVIHGTKSIKAPFGITAYYDFDK
jgi:Uncharacterized protein conserved in bacteria